MSICDFVSLSARTAISARLAHGKIAVTLAMCLFCAAVGEANAASSRPIEYATMLFLAPVSPADVGNIASASFKERFDYQQISIIRDILASPTNHVPLTPLTTASLPHHQVIVPADAAIVGIASMYNPNNPSDHDSGDDELASGERYDANDWTAAIRTDLRAKFGGVRFGKNYQAGFALVQSSSKQAIVRINDVGPLKRGRIIDLNERAMRYFDPTLTLGLIDGVSVTPLAGRDWALGPVVDEQPVSVASRFDR